MCIFTKCQSFLTVKITLIQTFRNDFFSFVFSAFLYLLQTYNLYAVVRPGPYICSEWDFGGLPRYKNSLYLLAQSSNRNSIRLCKIYSK